MRSIVALVMFAGASAAATIQLPLFGTSSRPPETTDEYQFQWPIKRVAVIGAGPSGLVAYRELTEAGVEVRIFERDSVPGGNWHYTDEIPLDAPVPNAPTAIADFAPILPHANVQLPHSEALEDDMDNEVRRDHRSPKPIWESLTSNAPSPRQQFPLWPWPAGTKWQLTHYQLRNYLRSYASYLNVNSNDDNPAIAYNTRVERVEKRINKAGKEQGWRLWLRSLEPTESRVYNVTWWTEDFDAVIVATGRYNAPSMPSIPGLDAWVQRFPGLVRHSRQYRRPEAYENQTVLIVGASVSGSEISIDLNIHARQIYQSFRPDTEKRRHFRLENYMLRIPKNTSLVGEIKRFLPIPEGGSPIQSGEVELKNGTILSGIDSVILATGFRYSFPFLSQYYDDSASFAPHEGSAKSVASFLPPDGSHLRDLYLDTFYIRDPTLAFMGMTVGSQIFLITEYAAVAISKVWTNMAKLPTVPTMRASYEKSVEERGGLGKHVMFLGEIRFPALIRYMVGWLNQAAVKYGGKQVDGLPKDTAEATHYWEVSLYGKSLQETLSEEDQQLLTSLGVDTANWGAERDSLEEYGSFYYDDW